MKKRIQIKDRFFLEALKSTGYDVYSAIYELIDNSVDAGSSEVKIDYNKDEQRLTINDNGCGMSFDTLEEAMNMGCDRTYSTSEIGYFGVGMKSSCLNLISGNGVDNLITIKTNNGVEKTIVLWNPIEDVREYEIDILEEDIPLGTTIIIDNVKPFQVQTLKKNTGVIFFPVLKKEITKIIINDSTIEYHDPLYRNSELTVKNFVNATVSGVEIELGCSLIDNSQTKHSWDESTTQERWSYAKGGIYFVYGGRYIEYGGTFGIKNNDPWDSRTRIELTIPKELTKIFEIKFNKTNGVNLKGNDKLDDVVRKLKDLFNWAKKQRQKNGEEIATPDEKDELSKINKELNKIANNAGLDKPKKEGVKNTDEPKKEKLTPKGKTDNDEEPHQKEAKLYVKKIFDLRTENLGSTHCFWDLNYENNVFIITLNESHVFYREIYRNMNSSGKKDMIIFLASMAYAQYKTDINKVAGNNDEFFWEEYWSQVSFELKKLIIT